MTKKLSQIYNWKVSLSDINYQVKYFIDEEGLDFELGSKEGALYAMKHLGFDLSKPYEVTDPIEHRNLRKTIVTCGFVEGFADKDYLKANGIRPTEFMIQPDTTTKVHEDLMDTFSNNSIENSIEDSVACKIQRIVEARDISEDNNLDDIDFIDEDGKIQRGV